MFFDEVEVPVENRVGEENRGWDYAKLLLGRERTGIARVGASKERLRRIRELAALELSGGRPLIKDERFREKLAALEVELKALEITQLRVVAAERSRTDNRPDPASSILKIKGSEIQQATTELLLEVVGPYAMPVQSGNWEEGWVPFFRRIVRLVRVEAEDREHAFVRLREEQVAPAVLDVSSDRENARHALGHQRFAGRFIVDVGNGDAD